MCYQLLISYLSHNYNNGSCIEVVLIMYIWCIAPPRAFEILPPINVLEHFITVLRDCDFKQTSTLNVSIVLMELYSLKCNTCTSNSFKNLANHKCTRSVSLQKTKGKQMRPLMCHAEWLHRQSSYQEIAGSSPGGAV